MLRYTLLTIVYMDIVYVKECQRMLIIMKYIKHVRQLRYILIITNVDTTFIFTCKPKVGLSLI